MVGPFITFAASCILRLQNNHLVCIAGCDVGKTIFQIHGYVIRKSGGQRQRLQYLVRIAVNNGHTASIANVPSEQVTIPSAREQLPAVGVTETKRTLVESWSVSCTAVAEADP